MSTFKSKIALITGAATGIGRATALSLAQKGAKIVIGDINEEEAQKTVKLITGEGGEAQFYKLDVRSKKEVDALLQEIVKTHGRLDLAVNNAGIGEGMAPLHEITEKDWDKMIGINLSGLFFCMQAEIKQMLVNGGGNIVNTASLAGIMGMPGGAAYVAAKHGVVGLTKTAALEYSRYNIRTNAVCPGFVETNILQHVPDKILEYSTQFRNPMKRLGQPDEVANAIIWLLSDEASFVTGSNIQLDGGFSAG